jgi:predicted DNA-binding transcriptional regulator YafY
MIDIERMYKYMDLLESKRTLTTSDFLFAMEISHSTFKRDLAVLRDRFDVPIVFDRDIGGYRLDCSYNRIRLPGIWFSVREIQIFKRLEEEIHKISKDEFCKEFEQLRVKLERACQLTMSN